MDAAVGPGVARIAQQCGPSPSLVRLEELLGGRPFGFPEAFEAGDIRRERPAVVGACFGFGEVRGGEELAERG